MNSFRAHTFVKTCFNAAGDSIQLSASHTLYIDDKNYIYLAGSAGVGDLFWIPIKIPCNRNGSFLNDLSTCTRGACISRYQHAAAIYNGIFSIWDLKDRKNQNRWWAWKFGTFYTFRLDRKDRPILYTTDETSGAAVEAWDVSDPKYIIKQMNLK